MPYGSIKGIAADSMDVVCAAIFSLRMYLKLDDKIYNVNLATFVFDPLNSK